MAGGDFPDIVYCPVGTDNYYKVMTAKAAIPLNALIDKYAPDIKALNASEMLEISKMNFSKDDSGKTYDDVYFINMPCGDPNDYVNINIAPSLRFDLWQKMGSLEFKSVDDYIPALKKMMKIEPTNEDGQKVYGVSAWFGDSWGIWNANVPFQYFAHCWDLGFASYLLDTREVISKYTDPRSHLIAGIRWYNKAYQAGILYPDAFTMKFDDYIQRVNTNRVLMDFGIAGKNSGNNYFAQKGEMNKGMTLFPKPTDNGKWYTQAYIPGGQFSNFISTNCKNPERVMQLLNFLFTNDGIRLIYNGVEGVDWNEVNGKSQWTDEVKKQMVPNWTNPTVTDAVPYPLRSGIEKYTTLAGVFGGTYVDPKYNQPISLSKTDEMIKLAQAPIQTAAANAFNVDYAGQTYTKEKYSEQELKITNYWQLFPAELKDTDTQIENYVNQNIYKLIMAKSDVEFDSLYKKFADDVKKLGDDKIVDFYKDILGKGKAELGLN